MIALALRSLRFHESYSEDVSTSHIDQTNAPSWFGRSATDLIGAV